MVWNESGGVCKIDTGLRNSDNRSNHQSSQYENIFSRKVCASLKKKRARAPIPSHLQLGFLPQRNEIDSFLRTSSFLKIRSKIISIRKNYYLWSKLPRTRIEAVRARPPPLPRDLAEPVAAHA